MTLLPLTDRHEIEAAYSAMTSRLQEHDGLGTIGSQRLNPSQGIGDFLAASK